MSTVIVTTSLARISAAIEKLEQLKAESTPGPWRAERDETVSTLESFVTIPNSTHPDRWDELHWDAGYGNNPVMLSADADLIVTLHSTIPFTLTTLAQAKHDLEQGRGAAQHALALADAILGAS